MFALSLSTMASPNHKARLAVVVPATGNQTPSRGKAKPHPFSSPRKPTFQCNGLNSSQSSQQSNGMPPPPSPRPTKMTASPRQPNGTAPLSQMNGVPFQRRPNAHALQQSDSVITARPKLLGVNEALQYSPFSSIVPFGTGK